MERPFFRIILAVCIIILSIVLQAVSPITFQNQLIFLLVALIVTGIPHGGVDHLVEKKNATIAKKPFRLVPFLVRYLTTMLIYGACWLISAEISLAIFLGISAWHFGETDIQLDEVDFKGNLIRFLWGTIVLCLLLLNHNDEVIDILTKVILPESWTIKLFNFLSEYKFQTFGILFSMFSGLVYSKRKKIRYWYQIFYPFTILIFVYNLPILLGFTLYFAFWHSIVAFNTISAYTTSQENSYYAFFKTWINAFPLTLIAFIFMFLSYFIWNSHFNTSEPTMLIFIFISTITLPHLIVMHKMYLEN